MQHSIGPLLFIPSRSVVEDPDLIRPLLMICHRYSGLVSERQSTQSRYNTLPRRDGGERREVMI